LAPGPAALLAFTLPVAAFLAGCIAARRAIGAALAERHDDLPRRLPRLARWLPAAAIVGAASFVLPESRLDAAQQGQALVASMAVIALFIGFAARDLVVLLIDVAVVFESVAGRVGELVMPLVAFLTYYALVTLVFTCLYRIVEMAPGAGGFRVHGVVRSLSFAEAMYFSIITMATVGYGDIVPESPLIRALAALEVITGVVLLLFGFREILRAREPAAGSLRRRHDPAERP
jgi:voltage-gated potassium channel